ncbi:MAG: MFS transporter [Acidobacteriota bacterium]|nr:MFS transporter [Acidobacteriota bacterium]
MFPPERGLVNSKPRCLPPIWVMGLTNATFGLCGGFVAVSVPEMLAAQGIPAGHVATAAAVIVSPGFWGFLFSPILDMRLSRRTYALVTGLLSALAIGITQAHHSSLLMVQIVMTLGFFCAMLYQGAVGGWMGALIDRGQDSKLGVWFTVSNLGAGGIMMVLASELMQRLSPVIAGLVVATVVLSPMLLFLAIPSPPPSEHQARESFARFWREAALLIRRREIQIALVLLGLPSASFALTNVLGGTGKDFNASDHFVGIFAGFGCIAAGIIGSFLLFPLAKHLPLRRLYLAIGIVGASFTFGLILLPHVPWVFAVAITGENMFQAMAFSVSNAITFEVIGPDNPFAATIFTLLISTSNLPIIYMQYLDGRGYDAGGLTGSFLTDALLTAATCVLLWFLLVRRLVPARAAN